VRLRGETFQATGRARLVVSLDDNLKAAEFARLALDYSSRLRVLVRLERARSYGNPGSPDFNEFLERSGYDLKGTIKSPLLIENLGRAGGSLLLDSLYAFRLSLLKAFDSHFDPVTSGTLKAMIAGNRYYLDQQASERLRQGATFHVLAISGMHVAIIAWVLLGRAHRRRAPARVLLTGAALWAYALMVGMQPPVLRATLMISVGLLGPLIFRRSVSLNTVALAAFIMLALKPSLIFDPGFQLSFIAVAAIIGLAVPLAARLRAIGEWRPGADTPHPPSCPSAIRSFAEALFWDARSFEKDMLRSPVTYRLTKSRAATALGRMRLQAVARNLFYLLITSIMVHLAMVPLMAFYFNRFAPIGMLLNIAAGALTVALMLCAVVTLIVGFVSAWSADQLAQLGSITHSLLANSIVPFEALPGASFRVAHYEGWQSILYAIYFAPLVALAALIEAWQPVDKNREGGKAVEIARPRPAVSGFALCAFTLPIFLIAIVNPPPPRTEEKLAVHFLDVGQGDAAVIVFPRGSIMVIDAGGEMSFTRQSGPRAQEEPLEGFEQRPGGEFRVGEAVVSRLLWSQRRTAVNYIIATHAHADHTGGFIDIIKNFPVGQAIIGNAPDAAPEYERFKDALTSSNTPLRRVAAGERYEIEGVVIDVLWPPASIGPLSENDSSIVLRLKHGGVSVLLAGDIEQAAEEALVQSGVDLQADILKVPHHGSKTSSSEAFIDRVRPSYGVISVGERSRFGHPADTVVNRYLARGVKLFQTGRDGMITVESDGATLKVRSYHGD
jgi:competence protein ComEC